MKQKLFEQLSDVKTPVAVGDRVRVILEEDRGVIEERLPRKNLLARPSPGDPGILKVTAANIDRLVIVVSARMPPLRTGLIDRFLVTAERQDMLPLIVVNKCDLAARESLLERLKVYGTMGYEIVFTSAKTGDGVERLLSLLKSGTSLLVGHSGVGKSSLMNRLDPDLALRTGTVAKHGRGRHTTTSVSLWRLPHGGHVVDTPGLRGFGLIDVPAPELAILMPDLCPFTSGCRFPDCTHDHEPDCAVRAAVEREEVSADRYDSYLRMLRGIQGKEDPDEM
ncbi:MAG: ribosome small subunit-dependent GTPase A [Planctomycetota bacterium]